MIENIHYVNNTCEDISIFFPIFAEAYNTGIINEDYEDIFSIDILEGYNPDGTNRMIINMA
jgi:hypothetical protein